MNINPNSDNHSGGNNHSGGMLTSIWGNHMWNSLHCISFTYPEKPTDEDKQHYKTYFETLKYVLPCCICRKHYTEHTSVGGDFPITDNIFDSRDTLSYWVYDLHKNVDKSIGINYDITYEDVCVKYNSYIADCVMSNEKKMIAHKNAYNQEAPFVPYDVAICFSEYAIKKGLTNFVEKLNETNDSFKKKRDADNNISDDWIKRNNDCWVLSKHMKVNGIMGFEQSGENHNLPTIEELQMLQMMSTTLSDKTLNHMIDKLKKRKINYLLSINDMINRILTLN